MPEGKKKKMSTGKKVLLFIIFSIVALYVVGLLLPEDHLYLIENTSGETIRAGIFVNGVVLCQHDLSAGDDKTCTGENCDEKTPIEYEFVVIYASGASDRLAVTSSDCYVQFRASAFDLKWGSQ